jgi:hypothetical protein
MECQMNRDDFFALAAANGWVKDTPLTNPQKIAIRNALRSRFIAADAPDLQDAPRVQDHNTQTMRAMDVKDAIQGLMEELG